MFCACIVNEKKKVKPINMKKQNENLPSRKLNEHNILAIIF